MSRIVIEPEGFELLSDSGERIAQVEWLNIDRIETYKTDFVTADQICIDFFLGETSVTVTEDDMGFEDLAPQLIANLDLEDPDWYQAIMKPTIVPRRLVVFDREEGY